MTGKEAGGQEKPLCFLKCDQQSSRKIKLRRYFNRLKAVPTIRRRKVRPRSTFLKIISSKFQEMGVSDFESAFLALKQIFPKEQFIVKQPAPKECESRLILINYKEHSNNWTVLGRKCRGCILHYSETGKLSFVKVLLDRGAELLTGVHETTENESMSFKKTEHLDSLQKELIRRLSKTVNGPDDKVDFPCTISGKTDGSLCGIGIYPDPCKVNKYVTMCPFASEVAKQCKEIGSDLLIPNSKGTCTLPRAMWSWTVTAILCDFGGMSYEALKSLVSRENLSEVDALKITRHPTSKYTILQEFMLKLIKLREDVAKNHPDEDISKDVTYFMFETVCPNRTCAWGKKHTELAISYEKSVFRLLGMTYGIGDYEEQYRPAYQFANEIDSNGFNHPCYWNLQTVNQIHDMILDLNKVGQALMTWSDFFELHPPNGGSKDCGDPEGYIIQVPINTDGSSKTLRNSNVYEWGEVDCNKLKTDVYYKTHKLRPENISELLSLRPETHAYLPLVANLHQLVNSVPEKLAHLISDINRGIKNYKSKGSIGNKLYATLPEKALAPFEQKPMNVKRKFLTNQGNKMIWYDYLIDLFDSYSFHIDITKTNKIKIVQLFSDIVSTCKLIELDTDIVALKEYISAELLHIKNGSIVNYRAIPPEFTKFINLLMND